MWQRSRGLFAIDIPEIKLGFTCSGHGPSSEEEELGSRLLLLLRVQQEMPILMPREGTRPCGAQLSSEQGFQERGGGRKAAGSGRIPAPNPCKDLFLFLGGLLCFLHPSAWWDELPSLPVPVSLWISMLLTGSSPQVLPSVVLRTVSYLKEERGFVFCFAIFSSGKAPLPAELCSCRGVCRILLPGRAAGPAGPSPGAGEVSWMP